MNYKYCFTVFTPTYNRAHTLMRPYESLKRQTFRDFEWVVVDDGSTDNTREIVSEWSKEADFSIRYIWQKNAHKKSAFNRGVQEAQGKFFLPADSDDEFLSTALEILVYHWNNIDKQKQAHFSAVTGLCINTSGNIIGKKFPFDVFDSYPQEAHHKYKVIGEKWGFQRTDILRRRPFPEHVKGLVPESIVWYAIGRTYKTRYVNDILRVYHRESISLTKEGKASGGPAGQAEGYYLYSRELLCEDVHWMASDPFFFIKLSVNHTRYRLHLKNKPHIMPLKLIGIIPYLLVLLTYPAGLFIYICDVMQSSRKTV